MGLGRPLGQHSVRDQHPSPGKCCVLSLSSIFGWNNPSSAEYQMKWLAVFGATLYFFQCVISEHILTH